MTDKDKEAFEKWFYSAILVNPLESHKEAWQAALEYERKRRSPLDALSLYDKLERERARGEKLEAENAKLRDCVEFYADLDDEAVGYDIRGVSYARQVFKELED